MWACGARRQWQREGRTGAPAPRLGRGHSGVGLCLQGAFGALDRDHEALPRHRHFAPAGGLVLLALLCAQARCGRCARWQGVQPVQLPVNALGHGGTLAAGRGCRSPGRLGQHQLRGAGLHHLPHSARGSWWPPWTLPRASRCWRELGLLKPMAATLDLRRSRPSTTPTAVRRTWSWWLLAAGSGAAPQGDSHALHPVAGRDAGCWWRCAARHRPVQRGARLAPGGCRVLHTGGAAALVVVLTWAAGARSEAKARASQGYCRWCPTPTRPWRQPRPRHERDRPDPRSPRASPLVRSSTR
jgi:cytochrome c oxidase assembly protein subunit 15